MILSHSDLFEGFENKQVSKLPSSYDLKSIRNAGDSIARMSVFSIPCGIPIRFNYKSTSKSGFTLYSVSAMRINGKTCVMGSDGKPDWVESKKFDSVVGRALKAAPESFEITDDISSFMNSKEIIRSAASVSISAILTWDAGGVSGTDRRVTGFRRPDDSKTLEYIEGHPVIFCYDIKLSGCIRYYADLQWSLLTHLIWQTRPRFGMRAAAAAEYTGGAGSVNCDISSMTPIYSLHNSSEFEKLHVSPNKILFAAHSPAVCFSQQYARFYPSDNPETDLIRLFPRG